MTAESGPTPQLQSGAGDFTPDSHCGSIQTANLLSEGAQEGTVKILNNSSDLYMVLEMNHGVFIEAVYAQFGEANNAPTTGQGNLSIEEFDFMASVPGGSNDFTIEIPMAEIASCNDIMLAAMVYERNMFGQAGESSLVWIEGTDFLNGHYLASCVQACN